MSIQERIQREMAESMRSKAGLRPASTDAGLRLSVLRMMKAALRNREIEKRKPLDESECHQVFGTLIKQRRDSVEQFRKGGREDLAAKEEAEIRIVEQYLPAPAGEAEVDAAIDAALAETGASSAKQMGAVMKAVMARLAGRRVDGKLVSDRVRARLP